MQPLSLWPSNKYRCTKSLHTEIFMNPSTNSLKTTTIARQNGRIENYRLMAEYIIKTLKEHIISVHKGLFHLTAPTTSHPAPYQVVYTCEKPFHHS